MGWVLLEQVLGDPVAADAAGCADDEGGAGGVVGWGGVAGGGGGLVVEVGAAALGVVEAGHDVFLLRRCQVL